MYFMGSSSVRRFGGLKIENPVFSGRYYFGNTKTDVGVGEISQKMPKTPSVL
jgi:hypothetical protein